ncbi:GNAT family N-acetyltransferase [Novosphingobium colocasiae]|uniref:N-acetyltransferase domain-containing protein n=1 Tax=Novosphingobium colocasiae TaxID=1256513 RepID=A0A918PC76_9SPHN|nr:GNAT family N-acetyltransferase [Novosphingobium colocasiae]GGY99098.1 hypothetical protein GCM10011614_12510 [Novosphingobium colocasiae]
MPTAQPAFPAAAPLVTTARLELWLPHPDDLDDLVTMLAGDGMTRYLGPARAERQPQFDRLLRNGGSWALFNTGLFHVRKRGERPVIGTCGVFRSLRGFGKGMDEVPEAGWIIRQDCWGQGFAAEAMAAALAWFDAAHGPGRVVCMIEQGNTASHRLAASLGFVRYDSHIAEDDGAVLELFERNLA